MPTSPSHCCLAELLPGECSSALHWHHVTPISAGGPVDGPLVPVCSRHHPMLESLARRILKAPKRCPHRHLTREARESCERRLNYL